MVEIGDELGKDMEALITDMNQPLGHAVGNALEMKQHIELLKGNGPSDLTELVSRLAGSMLDLAGTEPSRQAGYELAKERIETGDAVEKLREMVEWQGGDPGVIEDYSRFPEASNTRSVTASDKGYVESIDAFEVGMAARSLGAGRETMEESIDHAAGVIVDKKVGDPVEPDERMFELHFNDSEEIDEAVTRLERAVTVSSQPVDPDPLVQGIVDGSGDLTETSIRRPDTTSVGPADNSR
jgi:pyrimidine-nucleoside phosphorylase